MNIIIPLGGQGIRFIKEGYHMPKPLIRVMGVPIICWLLDNLQAPDGENTTIIIPYNQVLDAYRFSEYLPNKYPQYKFHMYALPNQTNGAAESILFGCQQYLTASGDSCDAPILCIDGDNFFISDIVAQWQASPNKNAIFTFTDTQENPIYSYVTTDENRITRIVEKEKISDMACAGVYGFSSIQTLVQYAEQSLTADKQCGEYYTSGIYQCMLQDNIPIAPLQINATDFVCLGTPIQVRIFCNSFPRVHAISNKVIIRPRRICFDLDGTLVTLPKIMGDYSTVMPIPHMIEYLRYLHRLGNTIIIYTARRMRTHGGNCGRAMADIGRQTFDTLQELNIPYHEIYFGKPHADVYIDDLAVNAYADIERELGFYESKIEPRDFNRLQECAIDTFLKESTHDLSGEIHWYRNIPKSVKDMFPVMLDWDHTHNSWYKMERLHAISISKIYLRGEMTADLLHHIMGSINRIHISCDTDMAMDIYANYCPKLEKRYAEYDYTALADYTVKPAIIPGELYMRIYNHLRIYAAEDRGFPNVIHGDPVLSNIMINQYGKIKFIDMRGKLGDVCTIYGDALYDWAKLYQSLIGYDEILLGQTIDADYKQVLVHEYERYILHMYGMHTLVDIKYITASLLFSLIPLHYSDTAKCRSYMRLVQGVMNNL